jgi:hypothetical protein
MINAWSRTSSLPVNNSLTDTETATKNSALQKLSGVISSTAIHTSLTMAENLQEDLWQRQKPE